MKMKILALAVLSAAAPLTFAQESDSSIEEILVLGEEFTAESESGSRLGLSVREIPATVDIIDGDAIRIRNDISLLDAVTRSAGFAGAGNPGNGGTSISARGFTGQDAVTKLYDGNHYFTMAGTITFPFDTWAVEQVEILKGPASVLYGQGGVAGAYNVIPKSPSEEFDGDLRVSVGQDGNRYLGIGVTGSLSDSIKGRIDYSKGESDNWVNNGSSDTEMIALALEWQATDDLALTFRYDAGDQSPLRYFGIPITGDDFNEEWIGLNLSPADTRINYDDEITRLIADWNISDSVSFNAEIFSLDTNRYWQTVETYFYDDTSGMIDRFDPLIINHVMEQTGARANFVFDTSIGDMPLKTSIGFETNDISLDYISNFNGSHPNSVDWGGDYDSVDPENFVAGSWYDVSDSVAALDQVSDTSQYALFGEAQLKMTDQFALVAGLRYDNIDTDYERLTYDANGDRDTTVDNSLNQEIDPTMFRLGFVYDLNEDTAFYGQLSTGETHARGGDVIRVSSSYREADTVTYDQFEVGLKQSLMDGQFAWNLALFDITRNNMQIRNPDVADPSADNAFIAIAEQKSQGIEVGFDYVPSENLITYANAAILDAERHNGTEFVPTPYAPELTINAGFIYGLSDNLRLTADYRFVDDRPAVIDLPSYTVVDLSLGYLVNDSTRLTMNAHNIFDEVYATADHWTGGQWLVGKPQTLSLTLDVDF